MELIESLHFYKYYKMQFFILISRIKKKGALIKFFFKLLFLNLLLLLFLTVLSICANQV